MISLIQFFEAGRNCTMLQYSKWLIEMRRWVIVKPQMQKQKLLYLSKTNLQRKNATYEVIKNGELVESFKVPFTREEIDTVKFLLEKRNDPDLLKGYVDGGPERQHMLALQVPHEHGLDNRKYAIDMLRETARIADDIVRHGTFSSQLRSKEAILAIRDALKTLLPSEESS